MLITNADQLLCFALLCYPTSQFKSAQKGAWLMPIAIVTAIHSMHIHMALKTAKRKTLKMSR